MMANGGVIGPVGVNMAALTAKKKHAVPFVVLAGSHKVWFQVVDFVQSSDCSREPENLTYCFYICQTAMSTLSSQSGGITKRAEISI